MSCEKKVLPNGTIKYFKNGELHREDGPAVIFTSGDKFWYINGKLHREDGPAAIDFEGEKHWYINGKRHREDGPAIEYPDGDKKWYLNGKELTQKEFKVFLSKKAKNKKIITRRNEMNFEKKILSDGTVKYFKNDKLHREDGPAIEYPDGSKKWYIEGLLHREECPAVEDADGTKCWYVKGQRHREDGPAVIYANGEKRWYKSDKLHREYGPAIVYANGEKRWYKNGLLHREDGPAIEYPDGDKKWCVNGKEYTQEQFNLLSTKEEENEAKIKTKFSVEEEAYVMYENKVQKIIIDSITIEIYADDTQTTYLARINNSVSLYDFTEDKIFKTKEDLLKSL